MPTPSTIDGMGKTAFYRRARFLAALTALAWAFALLVGLANKPVQDPSTGVREGMTEAEVQAILGRADVIIPFNDDRDVHKAWNDPTGTVTVTFVGQDRRVVTKRFSPRETFVRQVWDWVRRKTGW